MGSTKVRLALAAALLGGAVGAGGGSLFYRNLEAGPAKAAADDKGPAAGEQQHLVNVPSRCDGVLLVIGTEIKDGEKVPPGRVVAVKVGEETKKYRRLRVGDAVEEGQLLARLDDRLAREELTMAKQKVLACKAERDASEKTRDEAKQRYLTVERLHNGSGKAGIPLVSLEDLRGAKLTFDRYAFEEVGKKAAVEVARAEERLAQTRLEMYEIRSPVSGVITKLNRHRGEAVRSLEPVLQILTTSERDD